MADIRRKKQGTRGHSGDSPAWDPSVGHPETLPFPHLTGYWVNRLASAFRTVVDRELKVHDLTRRQVGVMMMVRRGLGSSAADLTRATQVDSTAITRMIDRLEEKGLIERSPDPDDGRRQLLHLTDAAVKLMPKIEAISKRVEERFEAGIKKSDLHTFHRVMTTMLDNVGEGHFSMGDDLE